MTKYDPLRRFLVRRRRGEAVRLTLDEIERIIGAILPKAAIDPAWWSNDPPDGHRGFVQCRACSMQATSLKRLHRATPSSSGRALPDASSSIGRSPDAKLVMSAPLGVLV
ncbi:MAG TPA: hypothetical protein VFF94_05285 [Novosphingobium sp.]|nr:hypothetical protein [Novosphingobium sp.]